MNQVYPENREIKEKWENREHLEKLDFLVEEEEWVLLVLLVKQDYQEAKEGREIWESLVAVVNVVQLEKEVLPASRDPQEDKDI